MIRLFTYIVLSLALVLGINWLLGLNGNLMIEFAGYRAQPSIGIVILALISLIITSLIIWAIIRRIISAPKRMRKLAKQAKKDKGVKALSEGFIALQAGDGIAARKFAKLAIEKLPNNGSAKLLEAKADLMLGDLGSAREHYKALISNSKTSLAALHGLFEQANAQERQDVALTFASKAYQLAPSSNWAKAALFDGLTEQREWLKALTILSKTPKNDIKSFEQNKRKKALLHTAIAQELQTSDADNALHHVKLALKLLPNFAPAALVGAQIHINRNEIRKASSLLRRVFNATKHPQIAQLYIGAQSGASAIDQLKRAKELIGEKTDDAQIALVLANSAINAYEWSMARNVLAPFISNPTQNICLAMADIEEGQNDEGKARNWLTRAVNALRDPLWVGDGVISDIWQPISSISGKFDVFEWKSPPSALVTQGSFNGVEEAKIVKDEIAKQQDKEDMQSKLLQVPQSD